jgi:hypothetical protein
LAKEKAKRTQCLNNLKQMQLACTIYADDNDEIFPSWGEKKDPAVNPISTSFSPSAAAVGINNRTINVIDLGNYIRYVSFAGPVNGGHIPQNSAANNAKGGTFENLGYLYPANLAGDGRLFFCPSYPPTFPSPVLSADSYSSAGLLSYGNINGSASVRCSYTYNPVVFTNGASASLRVYQRAKDLKDRHAFIMDYIDSQMNQAGYFAHKSSKGWQMAMTDGSVVFSKPPPAFYSKIASGGYPSSIIELTTDVLPVLEQSAR